MEKDLTYWGKYYGTDKATYHGYTDFYETEFKKQLFEPVRILEIGIKDGASLKMWKSRFPNAIVIGVDIHASPQVEGAITLQFDATEPNLLEYYLGNINFDLIIDDGSHQSIDVLKSFQHLWKNNLSDSGIYIYEDCHCSFIEEYNHGASISAYEYFKSGFSHRPIKEYWKNKQVQTDSGTLLIVS